ncbi:MAG: hypothetical protein H7249_16105 [Chitinophagaceae bacterium]|nr:hypothetical protein [Oligoflexus sp.]
MLATTAMIVSLLAQNPTAKSSLPHTTLPGAAAVSPLSPLSSDGLTPDEAELEYDSGDPLEYSQKERQAQFNGGIALNIGPVMPWSKYGASILWKQWDVIQTFSLGAGNFDYSNNYRERNYLVKTNAQSAYYAARWFVLGFGPLYLEPFAGLARWGGSIRPRGYDDINDTLTSSLNSRFDITGISMGGNIGLMWIFSNGLFLDYNIFNISGSTFLQKSFTNNSSEARKNVKWELSGPLMMSNLELRLGWSIAL